MASNAASNGYPSGAEAIAVEDVTFNNNVESAKMACQVSSDGLRNRTHLVNDGCRKLVNHDEANLSSSASIAAAQSAVSDLERTASLRGITVLRGPVPKQKPHGFGDEHVESYL